MLTLGTALIRVPADGWAPASMPQPAVSATPTTAEGVGSAPAAQGIPVLAPLELDHNEAMRTPQFWLLWSAVACNGLAGDKLTTYHSLLTTYQ
jgi:hypothetical protein